MFNNPYISNYNSGFAQQNLNEKIDNEIAKLQQMKSNMNQQPPAINQTFQLAPTNNSMMKYANTIEDVNKEMVYFDTPFFSKDMSVLWIKNMKGDIKTFELTEIIPKDDKDIKIEFLMAQIEELKKGKKNDESNAIIDEQITNTNESEEPTDVPTISKPTKKSK